MSQIADARGGYLFTATPEVSRWTASDGIRSGLEEVIAGGWIQRSGRFGRLAAARRPGFLTDHDIFTDDEMASDPLYRDILWPRGLGWAAGNLLTLPTGDALIFAIERPRQRGPIERKVIDQLDLLYPHIARSALVAARLQLELAKAASATLGLIGLPSLVFGPTGVVMAANPLIEALTDFVRWQAKDRFSLKDPAANLLLTNAMTALQLEDGQPRSFPLRDHDGHAAMVAHVIPLRGSSRDIFVKCAGVLILTPVGLPKAPSVELVASLFDLTPAEARVARSLTTGAVRLHGIAEDFGISRHTARSHLRAALEKTGCSRQAELVALLGGLGPRA